MTNQEAIEKLKELHPMVHGFTNSTQCTFCAAVNAAITALEKESEWPTKGKNLWFIGSNGKIIEDQWYDSLADKQRRDFLGIFRTEAEAITRRDLIREYIKTL